MYLRLPTAGEGPPVRPGGQEAFGETSVLKRIPVTTQDPALRPGFVTPGLWERFLTLMSRLAGMAFTKASW